MQWNVIPAFLALIATAITGVAASKTAPPFALVCVSKSRLLTNTVPTPASDGGDHGGGQVNQW